MSNPERPKRDEHGGSEPALHRGRAPRREVVFTDQEEGLLVALTRAFKRGADEVFIVAPELLFQGAAGAQPRRTPASVPAALRRTGSRPSKDALPTARSRGANRVVGKGAATCSG
ncbi:MAG: hypothetical protein U1E76_27955 [Planctomycetota bacterium]